MAIEGSARRPSPSPVGGEAAWSGDELRADARWTHALDGGELDELRAATEASRGVETDDFDPRRFPLPTLAPRLARIQDDLEHGPGVVRVRAPGLAAWEPEERARAFVGLARHIGTPVAQTADGERLLEVRDEGFRPGDPRFRGPHSSRALSFHTDRCDVIAFLCVRPALEGGANELVSSVRLHDDLLERDPALCALLYEPVAYLRHTVDGDGPAFTRVPVFSRREGHFAASFLRVLIDRADRDPAAPDLAPGQRRALDRLEELAAEPGRAARLLLEPGDLLFVNNWIVFHRREAFRDHRDPATGRLFLRLWLSMPNSRPLDPLLAEHFGATAAGALRGGMRPGP